MVAFAGLFATANAQLDVIHWLPPLVTDANDASTSNLNDQRLIITTPSATPVNYTIIDGAGITVSSGTVSNAAPVDVLLGKLDGGDYTSQTPGAGNIIDYSEFNTISTEGLIVQADAPIFVNLRQRSGAQGASLTAKGCAALGTEFRVGLMREREVFGTEAYRNHFVTVMATEDETFVTFDEFKPGVVISGGMATTEPPASGVPLTTDPITVELQAGESYAIGIHMAFYTDDGATASINDLNGSRVTADKPIVISSGTFLGSPTSAGSRDAGFDQMASISRAGTEYVVIKGGGATNNVIESPMVVATANGTDVFVNGSLTPINATPLAAGDYLYLDNNWNADNILYVETSEPTMMFATTGGSNSAATPGFSFIPPLDLDIANSVDNIYDIDQIGPAILRVVTTAGSTVTFNGNPPANGPLAVTGNTDWVVYTQAAVTGNMSVESTGPVAASVMNFQSPVGAQGYFSGFPAFKPQIIAEGGGCFPEAELHAIDPSGGLLRFFEWFYEDGTPTGVTGLDFVPTEPGSYFVRGSLSATAPCPTADSAVIEVLPCPEADIALTKTVAPSPTAVGDTVTFTITVTNNGPDAAPDIEVLDIVPNGYTYVSGTIAGGDNRSDASPAGSGLLWLVDSIAATDQVVLTFDAKVEATGDYVNSATATTTALMDDPADNTDTAEIVFAVPGAEMDKTLTNLTPNGGGNWTATYLIEVENTGNEPLGGFQIIDSIFSAPSDFPAGSTAEITSITGLTENLGYDGDGDTKLLDGSDTLGVSATGSVEIEVTFTTDGNEPYQNQAIIDTQGTISDEVVSEPSNNPDTPGVDDDPTPVNPSAKPDINAEKQLDGIDDNGDGSFTATFTIKLTNTGDEPLINVTLEDPLGAPSTFPAGSTAEVVSNSANLTPDINYDGDPNTAVLDGSDRLVPNEVGSVTIAVTFTPDSSDPYLNVVRAGGEGEFSGDGAKSEGKAEVQPKLEPEMEIDKKLDSLTLDGGTGLFTATFTVSVTNSGNEPITNIVLQDDLDAAPNNFPATSTGSATASSGGFSHNTGFNGVGDINLLTGTNSLAVGDTGTVTVEVEFPLDASSPYFNQVNGFAAGELSGGKEKTVSDDPDTAPANDPTTVDPVFAPEVEITKTVDGVDDNGDGTFTANFTLTVENTGNEPLIDIQITDAISSGDSTFPVGSTAEVTSTSANLTENMDFDGVGDTDVLDASDRLPAGASGWVKVAVTFTPDSTGPYLNDASVDAEGEYSTDPVTDDIDVPVGASPTLDPEVSLTKALDSIDDRGDGTFTANFTITVTNSGNETLSGITVSDNILLAPSSFPTGSTADITGTTGGLSENIGFDGTADTAMLDGSDTLAVGDFGMISLAVTFTPDGPDPYLNQATANATGAFSGDPESDISDDPATGAADDPTAALAPLDPEISLLKALDGVVDNGDGTFTGTFTITVENTGNEELTDVQVSDAPLLNPSTLPPGTTASFISASAGLSGNMGFNGTTDTSLLDGTDTLAVNQVETIQLSITFTPDGNEPYLNQATGRGNGGASGDPAGAKSDDPATGAADDGTEVGPSYEPEIEITKTLDALVDIGGGQFKATFTLSVTNTGNEPLNGVQIVEDLDAAPSDFPAGSTAVVTSVTGGLNDDPLFDGDGVTEVLTGTDTLAVNASGTVVIDVTFTPDSAGPFHNQASASGTGENSSDPANDDSGTPVEVAPAFAPGLQVVKDLDNIIDLGGGNFRSIFTISVTNTGNEPLEDIQVTDALSAAPDPFPALATGSVTATTGGLNAATTPPFNGTGNDDLLIGTDTLAPGTGGTITVEVEFSAVSGVDSFYNQASGSGTGEYSTTTITDVLSDDPDTAATDDPTVSSPPFAADMTVEKSLVGVSDNMDGTFTAEFTITVTNSGNEDLDDVQVTDAVMVAPSTFPTGSTAVVTGTTGGLNAATTPVYDGDAAPDALLGTDTLLVGDSGTVTIEVTFTPDGTQPYVNQATGTATGASSGQPESDVSDDPATPTPDDPTVADPPLAPSMDFTKELDEIVDNTDGTFTAVYILTLTNTGNEPLALIQVADDITAAPNDFPAGSTAEVTATTGGLTAATAPVYDGVANTDLLVGSDTLGLNGVGTVTLEVTFTPDGDQPYQNQASGSAEGEYSEDPISEVSDDPATAGTPDDPTETDPPLAPSMYLHKVLQGVTDHGDGTFTAEFSVTVFNSGNEPLVDLSVTDDVIDTPSSFPAGSTAAITATTSGLVANPDYDGDDDPEMVAPMQSIPVGGDRVITVEVTFTPTGTGPYLNQATANANGEFSGDPATGTSDDPADDDPDDPFIDPDDPTEAPFTLTPELTTTKTYDGIEDNGDGSFTASYTVTVENTGTEPLVDVQIADALTVAPNNFPATGTTVTITANTGLTPASSPVYDGVGNNDLLVGTDDLALGASGSISYDITFTPLSGVAYSNTASGTSEGEYTGDPGDDDGTASDFTPPFMSGVNVSKALDSVNHIGGGVFEAIYTITIANSGNEPIENIQASDAITVAPANYPTGSTAEITATTGGLTVNPAVYDGVAVTDLLDGNDTLGLGGSGTVTVKVTFTPDGPDAYTNDAGASADGTYSGDGAEDGDDTDAEPPLAPGIEVLKALDSIDDHGDGTFTANFTITINNTGNEALNGVQATDAINVAPSDFPVGSTAEVTAITGGLNENIDYDGVGDTDLLTGSDSLPVGGSGTVSIAVTFTPTSAAAYSNEASASGTGAASGDPASDTSPTADADPPLTTALHVEKNLDSIDTAGLPAGQFRATYTLLVRNVGTEPLVGVQVNDPLSTGTSTFPAGTTGTITGTSANLTPATAPAYNGNGDNDMLAVFVPPTAGNTLAVGEVGTITVEVVFSGVPNVSSFANQAVGSGEGEFTSDPTNEPSDNPDTPGTDDDPTLAEPPFAAEMEVEKALVSVVDIGGGEFRATYTITVENTGNEILDDVQVVDAITAAPSTFPAGSTATITGTSANLTAATAPAYDGVGNNNMLAGTDSLGITDSGTVTLEIVFTPDGNQPYQNQATGTSVGASSGDPESDESDDPATSDDPSDPTVADPPITTGMDVEKSLGTVLDNDDGTFTVDYTISIENTGNEPLINVTLADSLADFPANATVEITGSTGGLVTNDDYDGIADAALLDPGNTLAVDGSGTVSIEVTFTPDGDQPYSNSAIGAGDGEYTGDDAGDTGDAPLAEPALAPALTLTKLVGTVDDNGDGTFTANFTLSVENTGNEDLVSLQITDAIGIAPSTFPTGSSAEVTGTTGLTENLDFDGVADTDLLGGSDTLAIDAVASIDIAVTFTPDGDQPYTNSADASAEGDHSGDPATATDDDPADPPLLPELSLDKAVTSVMDDGAGNFTTVYTLSVENTGNEPLVNVQVTDAISGYPTGSTATISGTTGTFMPSSTYDGVGDNDLLAPGATLAIDEIATITLEVSYTADAASYGNSADASGAGDHSGDPAEDEVDAPPAVPPFDPEFTVEKNAVGTVRNSDGTDTTTFTISIANTGNEPIVGVRAVDDLSSFPTGAVGSITAITPGFTEHPDYDGIGDTDLLVAGTSLAIGEFVVIMVEVTYTRDLSAPYLNTATVSGAGEFSGEPADGSDTALAEPDTTKEASFDDWQTNNPLTGDNAPDGNPDGDIYSNALEYALCLHPDGGTNETIPGGTGGFCVELGTTSGTIDAKFTRPLGGLPDVTYTLQVAPEIGSPPAWATSTSTPVITDNGDGTETVCYPDLEAQNPDGIARLCVEIDGDTTGPHYTMTFGWHTQTNGGACETWSYPYAPKSLFSGTASDGDYAGGALDVSAAGGDFAAQLTAGKEYYLEFIDGIYEGHRFDIDEASSTASSIAFDTANPRNTLAPVPADLQGAYTVRCHNTLDSIAPPTLFAAQAEPDDGDRILAYMNGSWTTYWVFDMIGTQPKYWTTDGDDGLGDAGAIVIDACQGFFLHPKSGNVDVTSVGVVRDWDFACPLNMGYNLVGSGYPLDQSTDDRAMSKDDGDGMQDWFTASNDPLQADQVVIWLGDTNAAAEGYDTYFRVDLGIPAYDHWTYQGDSNLADADSDLLFELGRAAFYDMIVGHDRSDPADVWLWPAPWAP